MQKKVIQTEDGSNSIFVPELNETYHSKHGSLQEAMHIFILKGLWEKAKQKKNINILEIGFGTGLNALLSYCMADEFGYTINYTGVEAYPVEEEMALSLNYPDHIDHSKAREFFKQLHESVWEEKEILSDQFILEKKRMDIKDIGQLNPNEEYDLIYFDAFGPDVQPDLWTEDVFKECYAHLNKGGILMTYSCKGVVRRAMKAVGFKVTKVPGPKGKREISQAIKD